MTPREPFKVGDRVRVFGNSQIGALDNVSRNGHDGTVAMICDHDWVNVRLDVNPLDAWTFHVKQLRRLLKRERRRVWINSFCFRSPNNVDGVSYDYIYSKKPPGPAVEYVEFIEVRRGKK